MRRNNIKGLVAALIITSLIIVAALVVIIVFKKSLDMYTSQVEELQAELDANTRNVYVALRDIPAGEPLDSEVGGNVIYQPMRTGLSADHYASGADMGCFARVDIPAGQAIYADCVTPLEITDDTREYEMAVAHLMTGQKENDMVDIRIMFPNGEDYTVLSKKQIRNLALDQCIFYTYMTEDEIMRMSSAIIDAFTISGTKIYTTKYVESTLQEDAIPNYLVKPETLDLINSDPNITDIATETLNLQARIDLEERLSGLTDDQLSAVVAGHNIEDTASSAVILNNAYEVKDSNTNAYQSYSEENDRTNVEAPVDDNGNNSNNSNDSNSSEDARDNREEPGDTPQTSLEMDLSNNTNNSDVIE